MKKKKYSIADVVNRIHKVGGVLEFKTLRWSKTKVYPRKVLISISIPVVGNQKELESTAAVKELKERTVYKGCITDIKQTSPKYCVITFSFILKNIQYLNLFTNLLCNLAFNIKKELESKHSK